MALPAPARGRRLATMSVMALAVAGALALLASLRADLAYYFAADAPADLGEATELDPAALESNRYVRISGSPMASRTVHYSRLLGGSHTVFPLAGQRRGLVQVDAEGAADDRTLARREFSGRLVTVGELGGRFGAVRRFLEGVDFPVTSETYVLLADRPPGSHGWALGLAGLCLLVVLLNLLLLLRWFRPIRLERHAEA